MSGTPQKVKPKNSRSARIILICVGVLFLFIGMCSTCKNKSKTTLAKKSEIQIVVTQKDNGEILYSGPTPWKGGEYVLVDIKIAPNQEQCGKSVKVSCTSWSEDFYLVACGKGNVNFPPRERGKAVYVSAVK